MTALLLFICLFLTNFNFSNEYYDLFLFILRYNYIRLKLFHSDWVSKIQYKQTPVNLWRLWVILCRNHDHGLFINNVIYQQPRSFGWSYVTESRVYYYTLLTFIAEQLNCVNLTFRLSLYSLHTFSSSIKRIGWFVFSSLCKLVWLQYSLWRCRKVSWEIWAEGKYLKFRDNVIAKLYNRCIYYFIYHYLYS